MKLNNKRTDRFLFTLQGVGTVFVGIFLAAYLAGLPTTNVLHSASFVRIPLAIIGVAFLGLIVASVVLAHSSEKA